MAKYKVGLVGIGGFGRVHARTILKLVEEETLEIVAFADPFISDDETFEKLIAVGAKYYKAYSNMLQGHPDINFVVISTPMHLHKEMSVTILERGFNVLLEKPPAVTIQDLDVIIQTQRECGRLCGVNFQNTSSETFQLLLEKLKMGAVGEVQTIDGIGMWKRTEEYYKRTPWAGKLVMNGQYILDGTISNPFAHLLNNCLIIAGYNDTNNATPKLVQAELYKGHNIEAEDTSCVRIKTEGNVEVGFYTTLCNDTEDIPYIHVKGSEGEALWKYDNSLRITRYDGREEVFKLGQEDLLKKIYMNYLEVLEDSSKKLFSPIEACRNFILSSNGAFESCRKTVKIPEDYLVIREEKDTITTYIKDIDKLIKKASFEGKFFSEIGIEWAVRTEPFYLKNYNNFNLIV